MEPKDIVTTVTALVGAGLGIYNFFRAQSADRVRLRVTPKAASLVGTDHLGRESYVTDQNNFDLDHPAHRPDRIALEVVNLSKFTVTVDDVGLISRPGKPRIALVLPILSDNGPWPRQLQAREAVTVYFDIPKLLEARQILDVRYAYASTACGSTCYGRSGALKQFIRLLHTAA